MILGTERPVSNDRHRVETRAWILSTMTHLPTSHSKVATERVATKRITMEVVIVVMARAALATERASVAESALVAEIFSAAAIAVATRVRSSDAVVAVEEVVATAMALKATGPSAMLMAAMPVAMRNCFRPPLPTMKESIKPEPFFEVKGPDPDCACACACQA